MKKSGMFLIAAMAATHTFAQMQVDKPIQMMGGTSAERIIGNVGNPALNTDAVNADNVQSGMLVYANATLSDSTYSVALSPVPAGYVAGMTVNFKANLANINPTLLDVNGMGAKYIKKNVATNLAAGDIDAGQLVSVIYDGANFQLLAGGVPSGSGNYIQNQTAAGQNAGFNITGDGVFSGTGSIKTPAGNTAQRPATPTAGMMRYNTDLARPEYYNGGNWVPFGDHPFAVGGSITEVNNYRIHTFTSTSTFTPNRNGTVEVLIIGGGGGGGLMGGGGAGAVVSDNSVAVTSQTYTVTVGAGGAGGANGSSSSFNGIVAIGGGFGGGEVSAASSGGSGGGGPGSGAGAAGTPTQGNNGGTGTNNGAGTAFSGGGGGGSGSVGGNAAGSGTAGAGGNGTTSSITGVAAVRAGGGGGGAYILGSTGTAGAGGTGGAGNGGRNGLDATSGQPNTGSGGGGRGLTSAGSGQGVAAGSGGSGIVIIRYLKD